MEPVKRRMVFGEASKRLVLIDISLQAVEKLWEKQLIGWLESTFKTSDESH